MVGAILTRLTCVLNMSASSVSRGTEYPEALPAYFQFMRPSLSTGPYIKLQLLHPKYLSPYFNGFFTSLDAKYPLKLIQFDLIKL